ncbi:hypothetical protein GUJ93_ZPchr0007g3008 [Zizania palustris]|uniref:SOSEKI DIX-like domain-containing protein n=1 Tax=Zizania palustris TaxID=103762 RepID=A0A8J5VY28_ZIZPA|nr:hypothetical protein GUJ93_ZPchr0007g3008 [Zizania palustris]
MEKGGGLHKAGGGAGEVRRIDLVYFLSRGDRTGHSHLDLPRQSPPPCRRAVPRKYKDGYIWHDLMDDDLITPISDDEYVLKGCDVRRVPPPCAEAPRETSPSCIGDQKKLISSREEKAACGEPTPPPTDQNSPCGNGEAASRTVPFGVHLAHDLHGEKQQQPHQQEEAVKAVSKTVAVRAVPVDEQEVQGAVGDSINHSAVVASSARRMRVAKMLHNILTCGAAYADEAALRPVARQRAGAAGDDRTRTPVCPGMDGCGLRVGKKVKVRTGGGNKDKAKPKRDGGVSHKPASLPRCSQCGKEFKPQELHSHMQSCRGLREKMRSSSTSARASVDDRNRSSAARHQHRRTSKAADGGGTTADLFLTGS